MKNSRIIILLLCLFVGKYASPNHILGGHVTYECQGNGQFIFSVILYYDCTSSTTLQTNIPISIHSTAPPLVNGASGVQVLALNLISETDVSPNCGVPNQSLTCNATNPQQGALRRVLFQTAPVTLSGTIPTDGWTFVYVVNFRTANITNLTNIGAFPMVLFTKMYGYNGQIPDPCYDSSPQMGNDMINIACAGSAIDYSMAANDPDADNVTYEFSRPLYGDVQAGSIFDPGTNPPFYPFASGYSFDSPMPDQSLNPLNVPASINSNTGIINFTNYNPGFYILATLAKSYRCGQLISEVYREFNLVVTGNCQNNTAPTISNNPAGNGFYHSITVNAGDVVTFGLGAIDNGTLPNGNQQSVNYTAIGNQFGSGFTNVAAGCNQPPCATLSPPPPANQLGGTQFTFTWQTTCDHIAADNVCVNQGSVYNFVFIFQDNFCPIPSFTYYNVDITVVAPPGTESSPELKCIAVNPDGSTTLSWEQGVNANNTWEGYSVYHSTTPNGPFTLLTTITDFNTLTYTHNTADAANQVNYYYVTSLYNCVDAPYANILASMLLTVSGGANGFADLIWNAPSNPLLNSSFGSYSIYKEYPTGVWSLIETGSDTSYADLITNCGDVLNYRIEMTDSSGCVNVSSVDGDFFSDITVPIIPLLDSVSADISLCIPRLGWQASSSTDVECYVIYNRQNGIWAAQDTVCGGDTSVELDSIDLCTGSECFRIAAIDSCGNTSPLGNSHCTIYLTGNLDICERTISLNWTEYTGWTEGVESYSVYRSVSNSPYILLANVGIFQAFVDTNLITNQTHCYYIRAKRNGSNITSTSNPSCFDATLPKVPDFGYITTASVASDNDVEISALIDQTAIISHYYLERRSPVTEFEFYAEQPFTGQDLVEFTDGTAQTTLINYIYRIITFDTCQTATDTTNIGTTIHLTAVGLDNRTNFLRWNSYEDWDADVDRYGIFRFIDGLESTSFDFLTSVEANLVDSFYTYVDSVDTFSIGNGRFCYFVIAYENVGNQFGVLAKSRSNEACALQKSNFYVPNAFSPNAWNHVNRIFKPITLFVMDDGYDLTIWDKWGQPVFRTKDKNEGWDGTNKGSRSAQGVYVYDCKYRTALGEQLQKRGTITLIE